MADESGNTNNTNGGTNPDNLEKTNVIASDTLRAKIEMAANQTPPVIVVLMGPAGYQGKQWAVAQSDVVIGRSVECQVYIDDKSLSRSHAKFVVIGTEVSIIDLGSTNKTIVNGNVLLPLAPCNLKNNDQIKTGNVIFKFLERGSIEAVSSQTLYEKAQKDALTGAYSKGALLEKGPEAVKRSEFLNEDMSIIALDLDHFKKINDTYGHPAGDYVLKEVVRVIGAKLIRAADYFARFGGEEFVLILTSTNNKGAGEIGERIRHTIEVHEFNFEDRKIPVTISMGVATRGENEDWSSLFDRADKALFQSKQGGRNKVTVV